TKALNEIFADYSDVQTYFKTITSDNGSEFSELSEQGKHLGIDIYLAHPYAYGGVGWNGGIKDLLGGFIRKGNPILEYSEDHMNESEDWLIRLTRKILGFKSPSKTFP